MRWSLRCLAINLSIGCYDIDNDIGQEVVLPFRGKESPWKDATSDKPQSKNRRDTFFAANRNIFLLLLPPDNYIKKLIDSGEYSKIEPYEKIELQPAG